MERIDTAVEVGFSDLVGVHTLTGVERGRTKYNAKYSDYDESNYIKFCIDGVNYVCIEDPQDGYRSSMEAIYVTSEPCRTQIPPTNVVGVMREDTDNEYFNVLDLLDVETNDVVLSVGTGDTGDYYPYFVSYWNPAGLKWNQ